MVACSKFNINLARMLLESGADPNIKFSIEDPPLVYASYKNNIELVRLLLQYKAVPNITNRYGATSLSFTSDKEVARLLLENGADIEAKDEDGRTPLFEIIIEKVKIFKEKLRDLN